MVLQHTSDTAGMQNLIERLIGVGAESRVGMLCLFFALALFIAQPRHGHAGSAEGGGKGSGGAAAKTQGSLAQDEATLQTIEAMAKVKMDEAQLAQAKELVKGLSYTNMRVVRVFSTMPTMTAEELLDTLRRLPKAEISFNHLGILEHFVVLPGVDGQAALAIITKTGDAGLCLWPGGNGYWPD